MAKLATSDAFCAQVGRFYGIWSLAEITIDYAIGKYLKLPHEETHLLTAGTEFNRKARLLMALLKRSSEPKKADALAALKIIQNESLRNTFAHSFLAGTGNEVSFIERSRHGNYAPVEHKFSLSTFEDHVEKLYMAGMKFSEAIGATPEEMEKFSQAAFNI
jgi:hypothetical protein